VLFFGIFCNFRSVFLLPPSPLKNFLSMPLLATAYLCKPDMGTEPDRSGFGVRLHFSDSDLNFWGKWYDDDVYRMYM